MAIRITARKEILDGESQRRLPDEDLARLDGIISEIIENREEYQLDKVVQSFIQKHPDFEGASMEIEYLIPNRG